MTVLVALLGMMAVWRIVYMLQEENGPKGIFSRLQAKIAKLPDTVGGISEGFFCFYCLSIWIAFPIALLIAPNRYFIIYWFALSAGAIFISELLSRKQ